MNTLPRMLITLGDVAGIGPEIVVKGWAELCRICRPIVVGDLATMRSASSGRIGRSLATPPSASRTSASHSVG